MSDYLKQRERERKLEKIRGKAPAKASAPAGAPPQLTLDFAQEKAEASPAELVLSYELEAGVLVCGETRRWKDAIKAATVGGKRFRFSRRLPNNCAWYIPGSRRKLLERAVLERAAEQIRGTGPEGPTVQIDFTEGQLGTGPSFGERERERAGRAEERIERHQGRASKLEARAADQFEQSRQAVQGIPMGQPILVGHHSEGRHRRDVAKAQRKGFQGLETSREAERAAGKAATAAHREAKRSDPDATQRRIGRLETELRKVRRNLHGNPGKGTTLRTEPATGAYRTKLEGMDRELSEQIEYWAEQLGEQLGTIGGRVWKPADFKVGGIVYGRHGWALIKRVNKTSLTVDNLSKPLRVLNPSKLPYDRVERPASPEDDVLARREYADYFAKAAAPAPAPASKKAARLVADGTYPLVRDMRGTSQRPGHRDYERTRDRPAPPKVVKTLAELVGAPVMAGGGKPTRTELKVLAYAQVSDDSLHGVLLAPSRVSDDLYGDKRTAEHDQRVRAAMLRLKAAGYLARVKQPKGHEPRYKLATPKAKKAKKTSAPVLPGGYPPLDKREAYHFGKPASESRGPEDPGPATLVARDDRGYTALTHTQSKTFKTQKGAMAWLEKRIGAHRMVEAFLDPPDGGRSQKIKRGASK